MASSGGEPRPAPQARAGRRADGAPGADQAQTRVSPMRERAERERDAKLENIREQVQGGSLVIRKMTDEERRRYPVRQVAPKRPRFGR